MYGAIVESGWTEGSKITWKGDMQGKRYKDKGVILEMIPWRSLRYSRISCLTGKPDTLEGHHTVSFRLCGGGNRTHVALSQNNNADQRACKIAEENWVAMLEALKQFVETAA
jgi:uncharacterized protein YndB with AHSA1/START domain